MSKPVEFVKGVPVFNPECDELNNDWPHNRKIREVAEALVPQAADLLALLARTPTDRID